MNLLTAKSGIYFQNYTNYSPELKADLSASGVCRAGLSLSLNIKYLNSLHYWDEAILAPRNPQHKVEEKQVVR